jgi:glyoxylase-like metal-dependent hydrolase (beta-lactamase superfamily II)
MSTDRGAPVCRACGVQREPGDDRDDCPICRDDRQWIPAEGQRWTTMAELVAEGRRVVVRREPPGLLGVGVEPSFAIGQRALIVPGPDGNLLWDCVSLVDDAAVTAVEAAGGLAAIAVSHPHYYSAVVPWSDAFGGVPIFVHRDDRDWLARTRHVQTWDGSTREILPGRTLINTRVHFPGGTVLHAAGPAGREDPAGVLCTGDIVQVVEDTRWVSFMYSYPNLIPEHPDAVVHTVRMLEPFGFDVVYGAFWGKVVRRDGKAAIRRSAQRYLAHLGMRWPGGDPEQPGTPER